MGVGDYGSPLVQNGLAMWPPHELVGYSSSTPQPTVFGISQNPNFFGCHEPAAPIGTHRHLLMEVDTLLLDDVSPIAL